MRNRIMRKQLFALFMLVFCAVSCHKGPVQGTGIPFRASAKSPVGIPTKTSYGSIDGTGQAFQMLNWEEGDRIRLYSPQAVKIYTENEHFADYEVNTTETVGTVSIARMLAVEEQSSAGSNGLGWTEGMHYFYGLYPSPQSNAHAAMAAGEGNSVSITGSIPAAQTLSWAADGSTIVGSPDMSYAYMYASASAQPADGGVDLSFSPMFTAFQFEVGPGENDSVRLTRFRLSTSDATKPLSGTFSISGEQGNEVISCTGAVSSPTVLTVNMDISLTTGKTLVLTVLALPHDLTQLTVSFTGDEIGTRTLELKQDSSWMSFPGCKKYRIYGLSFPKAGSVLTAGESILWGSSEDYSN